MSAVCVLIPVVVASWPVLSAAVTAAAVSLGFTVAQEATKMARKEGTGGRRKLDQAIPQVSLEIPNSEIVTGQLGLDQRMSVTKDGVTVEFSRDARGKVSVCVSGKQVGEGELRRIGTELSGRVVQKYVYQHLVDEMQARQFNIVEEAVDARQAIHIKLRHWEQ